MKKFIYLVKFKMYPMKKLIFTLFFSLVIVPFLIAQAGLEVGRKAPDWMFTDADKKEFTMDSWAGRVLQVNYVDPDE